MVMSHGLIGTSMHLEFQKGIEFKVGNERPLGITHMFLFTIHSIYSEVLQLSYLRSTFLCWPTFGWFTFSWFISHYPLSIFNLENYHS